MRKLYITKPEVYSGEKKGIPIAGDFYIYWEYTKNNPKKALKYYINQSNKYHIGIVLAGEGMLEW